MTALFAMTSVAVSALVGDPRGFSAHDGLDLAQVRREQADRDLPAERDRPRAPVESEQRLEAPTTSTSAPEPPLPPAPSTTQPPQSTVATTAAPTTTSPPPVPDRDLGTWRAAYLPHGWIGASRSAGEVAERVAELRQAGFTHQVHNLGVLDATGRVPEADYRGLDAWVRHSRSAAPEQRIVVWVSGSESAHVDSGAVHDGVASFLADLTRSHGLDGVLLDLEPFRADNLAYVALLDRVRSALPSTWLGVTAPADGQWSPAFISEIAARVDGLSPMLYDSSTGTAAAYEEWARRALRSYADAIGTSAQLFPSIPSYSANRYHDPAVENVEIASRAIQASHSLDGAAVYWWWEFGDADRASWAALRDQL